ncbi:hypothetical protein [Methylobacterium radiodurans]|uniref:Uncharacterized protein n=1 Tax=Methylobacterium radiodurans TaxID=2202828 RepID=A0A2U8VXH3_9HYPH|nr:hypothetical protein [Methylobacterium radiodurans]AWN38474.1 hypothetical protein DK427_24355 [Methylobacterium radiodurans]
MKRPVTDLLVAASLASALLAAGAARAQEPGGASAAPGRPADLCQELLAFVKQPEPAKQAAATPPQQATAVSNPSGQTQGTAAPAGGNVQQQSGLSGPVKGETPTRSGSNPALAQANAAAKNPPAAAALPAPPKPQEATIARIEAAAASGDQLSCRAAAREMRVAGVVMPPPLLALSALDPKFFAR